MEDSIFLCGVLLGTGNGEASRQGLRGVKRQRPCALEGFRDSGMKGEQGESEGGEELGAAWQGLATGGGYKGRGMCHSGGEGGLGKEQDTWRGFSKFWSMKYNLLLSKLQENSISFHLKNH